MKKKLLILVNSLSFFLSHRLEVALAAQEEGYEVQIGYGEIGDARTSILSEKGISFFYIPLNRMSINPIREIWSLFIIWRIFCKLKPDIVHLVTIKPYLYGGIAARLAGVPSVVSAIAGLGILFNEKNWSNYFMQKLLFPLFYFAFRHTNQKIIVQNSEDKKILLNFTNVDKKKILLFHGSGINLSLFSSLDEIKGTINICFASRLLYSKGVHCFVSAARLINKKGLKARFFLAGNLDEGNSTSLSRDELDYIIKEKVVEVLGYQKNIPSLFSKSHIVCLPSFYGEGLPKVLVEAAAASRAVVTTEIPGCRDAIIPNVTGLLVPPKNPEKLADAIQYLIEHPIKRKAMGEAGRQLAERKFKIEKIVQNHLDAYEGLIKNTLNI